MKNNHVCDRQIEMPYQPDCNGLSKFFPYILSSTAGCQHPQSIDKHIHIHKGRFCMVPKEKRIHTHIVRV